ncbi:MAG: hypothetical protein ACR2NN_26915 [Bryobacteraceae bacterium]
MNRARKWGIVLAVLVVLGIIAIVGFVRVGPALRPRIVRALERHFDSDVELRDFHVSLFPPSASGDGLVLRHRQFGKATLIAVKHFDIDAGLFGFFREPIHVRRVKLDGVEIHVPPKHRQDKSPGQAHKKESVDFVADEIDAGALCLRLCPRNQASTLSCSQSRN